MKTVILKILQITIAALAVLGTIYIVYLCISYYTGAMFTAVPLWMLFVIHIAILAFLLGILILVYYILKK